MISAYPLQDVLTVRQKRQDLAEINVASAKHALDAAQNELRKYQDELDQYKKWRKEEEDRRYKQLMNQKIAHYKLNEAKGEIAQLREDEVVYANKVIQAEKRVQDKEEELSVAKDELFKCMQAVEKFVEHRESWLEESKREIEIAEDKELEEFHTKERIEF